MRVTYSHTPHNGVMSIMESGGVSLSAEEVSDMIDAMLTLPGKGITLHVLQDREQPFTTTRLERRGKLGRTFVRE